MRFIVLDGLDAAGKDTHAELIKDRYESMGDEVIIRSHPSTDNRYGRKAKRSLLKHGRKEKIKASTYYTLDILRSIDKHYGEADTVIFVRYLCGVAYLPFPLAKTAYDFFSGLLPTTDYMFFLDVRPSESLKRLEERNRLEMFENRSDLEKVRKKALELIDDWHIIDTNRTIDEAQADIESILDELDRKNGH